MAKTTKQPTKPVAAAAKKAVDNLQSFRRRQVFVHEYLRTLNATEAAKLAGYSPKTAYSQGQRLLKSVEVADAIQKHMDKRAEAVGISSERVLQEIANAAFLDPIQLFNDDGTLKDLRDMPEGARRSIAGIDVEEIFEGRGEERHLVGYLKKIRLVSKEGTLTLAGKHLKLFTDRVEHEGNVSLTVVTGVPDGDPNS